MHIVLDLQACQSPESSRRGIGRYSLALAKGMARYSRDHEITVLLNAAMGESIEFLRGQFDGLLSQSRIVTWEALSPTRFIDPSNGFRMRASEILRMQALRQLKPDFVHVASLFDGWADEVIGTVSNSEKYSSAVTLYDLIPLAYPKSYLSNPDMRRWYKEKIEFLCKADLLLAISQYSCDDAVEMLDISREDIVDISGAADDIFVRLDGAEIFRYELMHQYGLKRPFVMYAGGFDSRKNIGALVRAFALLPVAVRRAHQLLIVGGAPKPERAALEALIKTLDLDGDEVVFAGYVPDESLVKLYNLCALYVFPSLHEGFGLPALEAMSSGAPVIGSATSSLPEVIGYKDALFNPRSVETITAKMIAALTDQNFRNKLLEHAARQSRKFSWKRSANRAIDAFEAAYKRRDSGRSAGALSRPPTASVSIAFLPAPCSPAELLPQGKVVTYANKNCTGVSAKRSLADFARDRDSGRFDRIVIELADHAYCSKTLGFAKTGMVDIALRDGQFGIALHALVQSGSEGRELVVSLLYHSGGYPALRTALDAEFVEEVLGVLVTPESVAQLGRSQLLPTTAVVDEASRGALAWRKNMSDAISELVAAESIAAATVQDWSRAAAALSVITAAPSSSAQWLVDISNLFLHDAGTGIQRVVRHVLDELIAAAPAGYRVEPVYLGDDGTFRYARSYCEKRYFKGEVLPSDGPVEFAQDDVYFGLDLVAHLIPAHIQLFRQLRNRGVRQYFVVYDLLPILRPDCFDPPFLPLLRSWYEAIAEVADGVMCISAAVADEFESWLHQARPQRQRPLDIGWFHLGANLAPVESTYATEASPVSELEALGDRPTFLMVGTVEPRKGHAQVLAAFEHLWEQGKQINLLIIGKSGWLVDDLLGRLTNHPERGNRLFWFKKAGDDTLLAAYHCASALIMASEGEGFGLPLIEAAHHGLSLITRDLPVAREIAGDHAYYFSGYDTADLSEALKNWLKLDAHGDSPQPDGLRWNTWKEATEQLVDVVLNERWMHQWMPCPIRRFGAFDYRFQTQVGYLERGRMKASGAPGILLYGPYVRLSAGRYAVLVHGGGSGLAAMDVCSSHGQNIHVHQNFGADSLPVWPIKFEFRLEKDISYLEIRVWVAADADLWLDLVEIHPLEMSVTTPQSTSLSRDLLFESRSMSE